VKRYTAVPARRLAVLLRREIAPLPSRVLVLLFAAALLALPLVSSDPYVLRVVILTSLFAIYAASWDLVSSYAGQVSFGHALYFGVGAYGSALLNFHLAWAPWVTIPIGGAAAMATGYIVGIPCLRLRGSYLSLATLAFPLILTGILFVFPDVSGGELGISGLQPLVRSRVAYYYVAVAAMLVLCFAMWKIGTSHTGLVLHAIREDEVAARASGINTVRYKLLAFVLAGLFAGLAGGLYTHFIRIAGPSTLEVALSFQAVIWGIFGGVASIYGPVTGVFILYPITEILGAFGGVSEYRLLVSAVIVLLVLLFMPEGLAPWVRERLEVQCPRCKVRNLAFGRRECRVCRAALA
jgi:branched-chain amino acid transport system permease protein